ncbi:hypothetical protein E2C01_047444 [Portunus trituberculatus]|uniref:Uncharacterized protein n=1 Tax=Portunus trituberculatus TaxID=210409 RepID=A0A5B7G8V5_PORTR|nr:hypothetical protein [Portunus trituberculatus]
MAGAMLYVDWSLMYALDPGEANFCRVNSAPEGVVVPTVFLPSNEMQGKEEWRVVSSGAKRRKVLRALQRVETTNSFTVLEGMEKKEREGRRR